MGLVLDQGERDGTAWGGTAVTGTHPRNGSLGMFWRGLAHQGEKGDGRGARTESVPCSLKAAGDQLILLWPARSRQLSLENHQRHPGHKCPPTRKRWGGNRLLPANPSRDQHGTTKAQKWKPDKTRTGNRDWFGLGRSVSCCQRPHDGLSTSGWMPTIGCSSGSEGPAKHSLLAQYRDNLMVPHSQQDTPMPTRHSNAIPAPSSMKPVSFPLHFPQQLKLDSVSKQKPLWDSLFPVPMQGTGSMGTR